MSRWPIALALVASLATASTALADAPMLFGQDTVSLDRAAVRAKLADNRGANLARFRTYQQKGVFPNNSFSDTKLNVWLDDFGNFCAAATIIRMSGNDVLVQRAAEDTNFIKLGDVTQGALLDWILTSGLTQDEVAAIQEPFMPVTNPQLRRAEDRRLTAKYKQVDAQLVKHRSKSLDAATDRLLANRDLAIQFLSN